MAKGNMSPASERPLPHNLGAERAVLGAVLVDSGKGNERLLAVEGAVEEADFFLTEHQRIWRACLGVAAEGKPVDSLTVTDWLGRAELLEQAGGMSNISQLLDGVPRVSNAAHYAGIVRENARLREIVRLAHGVRENAWQSAEGSRQIAQEAVEKFLALLSAGENGAGQLHDWKTAVDGAIEQIFTAMETPENVMRWDCGIAPLDESTGGLRRQDVVLIVGMTGHGKTLLAEQYWRAGDDAGLNGQLYTAEMSKEAVATRALAHRSNVPLWELRRPEKLEAKEITRNALRKALLEEWDRRLRVMDRGITPGKIWTLARLQKQNGFVDHRGRAQRGLDFVVVDYDQLVVREGVRQRKARGEWRTLADSEFSEQQEFMNEALEHAKTLDLCFMLLCQPKKVSEEVSRGQRGPRLEEIFGSSSVANTAHHVLWIMQHYLQHLDSPNRKDWSGKASLYHLKARNDRPGTIPLRFDKEKVLFRAVGEEDLLAARKTPQKSLKTKAVSPEALGCHTSQKGQDELAGSRAKE